MFTKILHSPVVEALAAPHGVDRYLELVRPLWSASDVRAKVVRAERQTTRSVTIVLRPNEDFAGLRAGQFVNLAVEIDGRRHARPYSIASSEHHPERLELTISTHPDGLVSHHLRDHARPGMVVGLSPAEGEFHLPRARPERLVLIAGGSGITPVLAMLRTLCDERHLGEIVFLRYAASPELALYDDELTALAARHRNLTVARAYTRSGGGDLDGHLSREQLDEIAPGRAGAEAFVCGPPSLLEAAQTIWAEDGIERRLHVESFVPPALEIQTGTPKGQIRFEGSGLEIANDGRSLLEQAEEAGLEPESGCRMGICHTCSCTKRAGSVRNLLTGEVSDAEDEQIQICVSAPVGDVAIEI
jgi:stearoyl-CoA 9-desaturase NADPH oxidoreductase